MTVERTKAGTPKKERRQPSLCLYIYFYFHRAEWIFFLNTGLVGDEAKRSVLSQLRDKRKSDLKERHKVKFGKILHIKRACHVLFNR